MWNCDHCEIKIAEISGYVLIKIVFKMIQYCHYIRKLPPIQHSVVIYSNSDSDSGSDSYSDFDSD